MEVATTHPQLVDPRTGELIPLDATTDRLAKYLSNVRELEAQLRSAKLAVSEELHKRMDEQARWSIELNGWKIAGESPNRVEYDGEALNQELLPLVQDGALSEAAVRAAVDEQIVYKPSVRGINQLKKLGGQGG